MKAYVTTIVRYGSYGWLYKVDLQDGGIEKKAKIESNASVAVHGGPHGLTMFGDTLIAGTYNDVRFYDRELREINKFSHPFLCGVHGMSVYNKNIWLSSCNNDCVLSFTLDGKLQESCFLEEDEALMNHFSRGIKKADRNRDYRQATRPFEEQTFHVNHVQEEGNSLYLSLHKHGVIWDLKKGEKIIEIDSHEIHDGQFQYGRFFLNDTKSHELKVYGEDGREIEKIEIDVLNHIPKKVQKKYFLPLKNRLANQLKSLPVAGKFINERKCRINWLRGLCVMKGEEVIVGSSPPSLFRISLRDHKIVKSIPLGTNICEAIFGIVVDESDSE